MPTLSYRSTGHDLTASAGINHNHRVVNQKCSPPKFYAVPHNRLVEEGETVQFQCAIAGHPTPWSTWDHDGLIVTQTSRIRIRERGDDVRILEIEQVTHEDAGLYRITLENDYGRIEATARLDILTNRRSGTRTGLRTSASPSRSITSSRRIMGNSTRIGGRLALAANFRGTSVPARKFFHDGAEVYETDRTHIVHAGDRSTLIVADACAADQGWYTCMADTEFSIAASSTLVTFDDDERQHSSMTIVQPLPSHVRCCEGIAVDLQMIFNSRCCPLQPFEMRWFRDEEPINDSDEFRYIDHGNGRIALRVIDPFVFDSGRYRCEVKTECCGSVESDCLVRIDEMLGQTRRAECDSKPMFVKHPVAVVAVAGSAASFCATVLPAAARVQWTVCGCDVNDSDDGIIVSLYISI